GARDRRRSALAHRHELQARQADSRNQSREAAQNGRSVDQVRDDRRIADQGHHGRARSEAPRGLGRHADAHQRQAARTRKNRNADRQTGESALKSKARESGPSAMKLDLSVPAVMGVLNVTPDSFSDGGRYADTEAAIAHGRQMLEAGARIVDVGGESTRPGAQDVPVDEEIRRVIPVVRSLAAAGA